MSPDKPTCPAEITIALVSGRWKLMIILRLLNKTHRFNELQRDLGTITHRTLARTLKEMESDGLVHRADFGETPPRVEYSLTAKGRTLEPILVEMERWADTNADGHH
jgi:DNA-binding HxlR family transcriptional regulator